MIVKICGIKTLAEALASLEAGADLLGFNFYPPSPRCITIEACAHILSVLRLMGKAVIGVGVFVNEEASHIQEVLDFCGLDLAQLSGDEPADSLAALNGRAYKSVRPISPAEAEATLRLYGRPTAPALLVDAHVKGAFGGTGQTASWEIARYLAARAPVLLAGGLTPQNVAEAVRMVQPWGVDVASGVESGPGVKDPARIADFIAAARAV